MSSWEWWRPVVVGAASAFDIAGRTIPDCRPVLRSEGALRRVLAGQLGFFFVAALCLAVGTTAILLGVPEGGFFAVLGPLSAPSLAFLARSEAAPSRSGLLCHLFSILAAASLVTALICFFDAGRVVSASVFGAAFLVLGISALFLHRSYRSA